MNTLAMIEVMKAYEKGKKIQQYDGFGWKDIKDPSWDWEHHDYRINPKEKYRPYRPYKDTSEMINDYNNKFVLFSEPASHRKPTIWVKTNYSTCNYVGLITTFWDDAVFVATRVLTMEELFEKCTYLNGDPCGARED